MTQATYDSIGEGYARRRRPDPRIAAAILAALGPALRAGGAGVRCVVKGSRSSAMDVVIAALLAADSEGTA